MVHTDIVHGPVEPAQTIIQLHSDKLFPSHDTVHSTLSAIITVNFTR
jgi:hypothetical protein